MTVGVIGAKVEEIVCVEVMSISIEIVAESVSVGVASVSRMVLVKETVKVGVAIGAMSIEDRLLRLATSASIFLFNRKLAA